MGSKRSLAPAIAKLITNRHPNAVVADAFAGTCAIGTAVAPHHRVIANDVHEYAAVIARALLSASAARPTLARAKRELQGAFEDNLRSLMVAVQPRADAERELLTRANRSGGWEAFRDFTLTELSQECPRELPLGPSISAYRTDPLLEPFALFSMYFASAFFGIRQAAEIDSLRFAITRAPSEHQDYYLTALLHAISHCAATPGHFAQHLVPRDQANTATIAKIRQRSVYRRFVDALAALEIPRCADRQQNLVTRRDATPFVREVLGQVQGELIIYADPPYSKAQYSRYYHVQETLVLYDYPEATGKGRYRGDRFNTDFSQRAQVQRAMHGFVSAAAATGAVLYLSYPKNGLLYESGADLLDLLRTHYPVASIASTTPLSHSTLGGAPGSASIDVLEDVYHARWN